MFSTSYERAISYLFGDQRPRLLNDFKLYDLGSKRPHLHRAYILGACNNLGTTVLFLKILFSQIGFESVKHFMDAQDFLSTFLSFEVLPPSMFENIYLIIFTS